jgi:hypothetical protein
MSLADAFCVSAVAENKTELDLLCSRYSHRPEAHGSCRSSRSTTRSIQLQILRQPTKRMAYLAIYFGLQASYVIPAWRLLMLDSRAFRSLYIFAQNPQQSMSFWLKYSTSPKYSVPNIN